MKRTPLKRKTPMRRQWMKRSSRKNSYARRTRYGEHMIWVKSLPCCAIDLDGHVCSGPIEADHAGARGMGRKCHDFQTIPLCKAAHDARPGRRAPFDRFTRESFREWITLQINQTMDRGIAESPQRIDLIGWMRMEMPDLTDDGIRLVFRNWPRL